MIIDQNTESEVLFMTTFALDRLGDDYAAMIRILNYIHTRYADKAMRATAELRMRLFKLEQIIDILKRGAKAEEDGKPSRVTDELRLLKGLPSDVAEDVDGYISRLAEAEKCA